MRNVGFALLMACDGGERGDPSDACTELQPVPGGEECSWSFADCATESVYGVQCANNNDDDGIACTCFENTVEVGTFEATSTCAGLADAIDDAPVLARIGNTGCGWDIAYEGPAL